MRKRRTIARTALFEGIGIHSGEPSFVSVSPLEDSLGICFKFGGSVYSIAESMPAKARRSTLIVFPEGRRLLTVEHLLSALVGMEIDDVIIEARDGGELPILDGSALPFVQGFKDAGIIEKDEPAGQAGLAVPVCLDRGASSIAAIPSEEFRVTYVIHYPGSSIGTEMKDVTVTPESFADDVAPARTFAPLSEIDALRKEGLGSGGSLDNALVIGDDGPLGGSSYRLDGECAAHKILDLLGDLALTGKPPTAHYICIRGGHELHSKLALRLRSFAGIIRR
jgi:UDP-3-O-[3-hydroxymyristoyl] N-acetylglucosamine deacetylase